MTDRINKWIANIAFSFTCMLYDRVIKNTKSVEAVKLVIALDTIRSYT